MSDKGLYFLAIIPDNPVHDEVYELKQVVKDRFGSKGALKSPPHITLHMPFKWRLDREDDLVSRLEAFDMKRKTFDIQLNGFDYFEPRVVFVDVADRGELRLLYQDLSKYVRRELKLLNADYKSRGFHPHMTIGFRDLKKPQFYEAKTYFDRQAYKGSIEVKGFWLLKHDGQQWHPFKLLGFEPPRD